MKIIHEGAKDFLCDDCGKSFGRKNDLQYHTKAIHEGIKDFESDECFKSFHRERVHEVANKNLH